MSEKQKIVEKFLASGRIVRIHLDGRIPDVQIPERLHVRDHVILEIGYSLPIPIPDLVVNEFSVSGTMVFNGAEHFVCVPWFAIFGAGQTDSQTVIWQEDVPVSLRERAATAVGSDVLPGLRRPPARVISLAEYRAKKGR